MGHYEYPVYTRNIQNNIQNAIKSMNGGGVDISALLLKLLLCLL